VAIGLVVADTDVLIDHVRGAKAGAAFVRQQLIVSTERFV
jgi:hypothetical protein